MDYIELAKAICWPLAIIIGVFTVGNLARKGRLASITASKDGGIALALAPMERRDEARYYMDRRIAEIDSDLTAEVRAKTSYLRKPIQRAVAASNLCSPGLAQLAADLRGPLYHAVDENDFKTKLAVDSRAGYIDGKMVELAGEYADLVSGHATDACARGPDAVTFPDWKDIEGQVKEIVETWADYIVDSVVNACRRKIEVYNEYRGQFADAKDERFLAIVDKCIEKNTGYIVALGGKP